jgi:hypothetical protein
MASGISIFLQDLEENGPVAFRGGRGRVGAARGHGKGGGREAVFPEAVQADRMFSGWGVAPGCVAAEEGEDGEDARGTVCRGRGAGRGVAAGIGNRRTYMEEGRRRIAAEEGRRFSGVPARGRAVSGEVGASRTCGHLGDSQVQVGTWCIAGLRRFRNLRRERGGGPEVRFLPMEDGVLPSSAFHGRRPGAGGEFAGTHAVQGTEMARGESFRVRRHPGLIPSLGWACTPFPTLSATGKADGAGCGAAGYWAAGHYEKKVDVAAVALPFPVAPVLPGWPSRLEGEAATIPEGASASVPADFLRRPCRRRRAAGRNRRHRGRFRWRRTLALCRGCPRHREEPWRACRSGWRERTIDQGSLSSAMQSRIVSMPRTRFFGRGSSG